MTWKKTPKLRIRPFLVAHFPQTASSPGTPKVFLSTSGRNACCPHGCNLPEGKCRHPDTIETKGKRSPFRESLGNLFKLPAVVHEGSLMLGLATPALLVGKGVGQGFCMTLQAFQVQERTKSRCFSLIFMNMSAVQHRLLMQRLCHKRYNRGKKYKRTQETRYNNSSTSSYCEMKWRRNAAMHDFKV